jgi:hypothetical protein
MAGGSAEIEFLGTAIKSTLRGASAAVGYRFRVDRAREVVVWVGALPVKYTKEEIQRAAEILIRMKLDAGLDLSKDSELSMDKDAMAGVARQPGWSQKR